ncbi:hypothetical protein ABIB26_003804 [Arthrobacter sp. UYEF20]
MATANCRRTGRPSVVDADKLEHAAAPGQRFLPPGDYRQDRPETHHAVPAPAPTLPRPRDRCRSQGGPTHRMVRNWPGGPHEFTRDLPCHRR